METHVQRQQERDQKKVIGPGFGVFIFDFLNG